jgi:transposase
MGKRLDTRLSEEDRLALEQVVKKSPDWRARERAKTVLLLGQGLLRREVAQLQELNVGTVGQTWQRWGQEGMACLSDKPRSGAPRKLDETEVKRLAQWAHQSALSAPELLLQHTQAKGTRVHVETLIRYLKEEGLVCKRTRHSLKKSEMTPLSSTAGRNSRR